MVNLVNEEQLLGGRCRVAIAIIVSHCGVVDRGKYSLLGWEVRSDI